MDFRILGPLEVEDDGRSVQLGGARQVALLSILLIHRGEVVSTDRLVESLYDGEPPATATKSLQAHVSRLRSALKPAERLHTRGGGYVLETRDDEVDADRVARFLAEGRRSLAAAQHEIAADQFAEALSLWRGASLADVEYASFAQDEIARLNELRLECVEGRLAADLELGRHADVVAELEQLVADHPLRERLREQHMLALYRCGRQAEALGVYQDGRRVLIEQLGLDPGRELQDLEQAILNQDPALEFAAPEVAEARAKPTSDASSAAGVFVGRQRELAQLESALMDAEAGRARLALLSGEAGIGKSRLLDEFSSRAAGGGVRVLSGSCWEAGGAPAFWPWVQALRAYVHDAVPDMLRAELGTGARDVAHLVPELRELFPDLPEAPSLDSEEARFRLFDSTATFVRRAAAGQPWLVVLDDMHAADASSLQLLEFVAASLAGSRVLILAAYREPELETGDPRAIQLANVARHASNRIVLGGFDGSEVASYIQLSSELVPHPSLIAAIAEETEGNPLFVGEIVRLLAAEGLLDQRPDADWRPVLPETVKEVIGRRLNRLSGECRDTLTLASVIGRELPLDVLERLSGRSSGELLSVLDEAVAARVVTDVPGAPGRMRFTHALIRDTLYDALPQGRRLELHRETGEALESLRGTHDGEHLSELAHHFFHALPVVDVDTAVRYARRAGDYAEAQLGHEEAVRLYRNALHALTLRAAPELELERRLYLALGEALARGGDTPEAKDAFLQAAALARAADAPDDLAAAALGYAGRLFWARPARDRLVVTLLEEALEALGDEDTILRARVLSRLAGALRDEKDPRRRIEVGELAVATARRTGDRTALISALAGLSAALHGLGGYERKIAVAEELREIARSADDKEGQFEALSAEILVYAERNEFDRVRERIRMVTVLSNELRQPSHHFAAVAFEAELALFEGRFSDAEMLIPRALELGRRAQALEAGAAYAIQLYLLRREQGRAEEAYEAIETAAADSPARPLFRCALAALAVDISRLAEARRHFEEVAANRFDVLPRDNEWLLATALLCEVCRALGDTRRAEELYEELAPRAGLSTHDGPEGMLGSVDRGLGVLAATLGSVDDAIAHHREAVRLDSAVGAVPWAAHAQIELAELLAGKGEFAEARVLRDEAGATAADLGMLRLQARIEALDV